MRVAGEDVAEDRDPGAAHLHLHGNHHARSRDGGSSHDWLAEPAPASGRAPIELGPIAGVLRIAGEVPLMAFVIGVEVIGAISLIALYVASDSGTGHKGSSLPRPAISSIAHNSAPFVRLLCFLQPQKDKENYFLSIFLSSHRHPRKCRPIALSRFFQRHPESALVTQDSH